MTIVKIDTNTNLTTMSDMCGESSGIQRELRFVLLVKKKKKKTYRCIYLDMLPVFVFLDKFAPRGLVHDILGVTNRFDLYSDACVLTLMQTFSVSYSETVKILYRQINYFV